MINLYYILFLYWLVIGYIITILIKYYNSYPYNVIILFSFFFDLLPCIHNILIYCRLVRIRIIFLRFGIVSIFNIRCFRCINISICLIGLVVIVFIYLIIYASLFYIDHHACISPIIPSINHIQSYIYLYFNYHLIF